LQEAVDAWTAKAGEYQKQFGREGGDSVAKETMRVDVIDLFFDVEEAYGALTRILDEGDRTKGGLPAYSEAQMKWRRDRGAGVYDPAKKAYLARFHRDTPADGIYQAFAAVVAEYEAATKAYVAEYNAAPADGRAGFRERHAELMQRAKSINEERKAVQAKIAELQAADETGAVSLTPRWAEHWRDTIDGRMSGVLDALNALKPLNLFGDAPATPEETPTETPEDGAEDTPDDSVEPE
jgi:hypothetical protein